MITAATVPTTMYRVGLRASLSSPAFMSLHDALGWVRKSCPGAFFDLENLNGRFVLAIFWCPDGQKQIRIGSVGSLF